MSSARGALLRAEKVNHHEGAQNTGPVRKGYGGHSKNPQGIDLKKLSNQELVVLGFELAAELKIRGAAIDESHAVAQ